MTQTNESRPTLVFSRKRIIPASFVDAMIISTVAVAISLGLFGVFVLLSGKNPFDVYQAMFEGAFGSGYAWQNSLIHAAPLLLTALCVALPARVGMMVIGGEGCFVLGGLFAVLTAHMMPAAPAVVVQISMIVVGCTVGGLWIGAVGALRQFRGVNETISSLLMNYIAIAILNHCVEGPMNDPAVTIRKSSWNIGVANMFSKIPGTDIHIGLLFGVLACVFAWVLMDHTPHGFATRIVGGNVRAAKVAGLSVAKYSLIACFLGGAAAALAGVVYVGAISGDADANLNANLGYAGILVAFVARQNPLAIIPVSVLLGGVAASGDYMQMQVGLESASVQVFQGMLFLVILGLDTWAGRLHELRYSLVARPFVWLSDLTKKKSNTKGVAHVGSSV